MALFFRVNVVVLMVAGSIVSENVAVIFAPRETPVAPCVGDVDETVGGVVSVAVAEVVKFHV